MRISDWSSDVCSSDLGGSTAPGRGPDSRFRGNDERGQDRERAQHRPGPRPEPRPHDTNAPRPPANAAEAMFFDDAAPRREPTPHPPPGGEEFPMDTLRIPVGHLHGLPTGKHDSRLA